MTTSKKSKLFSSLVIVVMLLSCLGESAFGEVKPVWTRQIGSSGDDASGGVAVDKANGFKYVAGHADSGLSGWGFDGHDPQFDITDIVLVKYDSAGAKVWSTQFGFGMFLVNTVVGVAVSADGQYVFVAGMNDMNSNLDIFVVMFNSVTGAFENWVQFGSPENDYAAGIVVGVDGYVYVTGYTEGDMGPGSLGYTDCFLAKLDNGLNPIWTQQFGTGDQDIATGADVSPDGQYVYVTGYTRGALGTSNADGFLAKFLSTSPTGSQVWSRQFGTSAEDIANAVAVSADGLHVYLTGYTLGALGENVATNAGGADIFLVKYDAADNPVANPILWKRQFGTSTDDVGVGVAVDTNDNVFITGKTNGDLDGNSNAGLTDMFLAKYNSLGFKQWTRQYGASGMDSVAGLALDAEGNVYVTGKTDGSLYGNLNMALAVPGGYGSDIFLVKYDPMLNLMMQFGYEGIADDLAKGAAVDADGNAYMVGHTTGGLDGNVNAGKNDIFLVKYDNVGVKQWTRLFGTIENDLASGVAVDGGGNIYITGFTEGVLGTSSAGLTDVFLAKYNSLGEKKWIKQLGTDSNDIATGVAVDKDGYVYVTGYTGGKLGDNVTGNAGYNDIFLVKYNSTTGNPIWKRQLGTSSDDMAHGVAVGVEGGDVYVYVSGETFGVVGDNVTANAGNADIFLVKYSSSGGLQWKQQRGTTADDSAYGVAVSPDGTNVYIAGYTLGNLDGQTNLGNEDIFIIRHDSAGTHGCTGLSGSDQKDFAWAVAADKNGYAYVTGYTAGGLDGNINAGMNDMVLTKFDSACAKQWTRQLGTSTNDTSNGIVLDVNGDAYLAGNVASSLLGNPYFGGNDVVLLKYNTGSDTIVPDGSLLINGGASITKSAAVALTVSCADAGGCSQMRFSNDAFAGNPDPKWSLAEKYSTSRNWDITDPLYGGLVTEGTKTVYIQFWDFIGNLSSTVSATIVLDTIAPSGGSPAILINGGAPFANNTFVTLTLSADDLHLTKMMLSSDGSFKNVLPENFAASRPWLLPSGDGSKTVYVKFGDSAGNWSSAYSASITLDQTIPSSGSVVINNNDPRTANPTVVLSLACADANGCSQMQFSNDLISWSTPTTFAASAPWTLSSGDGDKTVYARFIDAAGNASTFTIGDTIKLDTTQPVGSLGFQGLSVFAPSPSVTLSLSCSDVTTPPCAQMRFSNDGLTWSDPVSFATSTSWNLNDVATGGNTSDGVKTVYARFSDTAGNWTASNISKSIVLDTAPPTGSVVMSGVTTSITDPVVTLALSCVDANGCSQMQFSNDGSNWSGLVSFATSTSWSLINSTYGGNTNDGTKTVYVRFKDTAGNVLVSGATSSTSVYLDSHKPVTSADNKTNTYLNAVGVNLTCSDNVAGTGSGCFKTFYTVDTAPSNTPTTASTAYTGGTITIDGTASPMYLKFFSLDNLGNEEAVTTETYTFGSANTRLSILLSTQTIMQSGSVDVSGSLSQYSTSSIDLKGLPIDIVVSLNSVPTATFTTYTNSVNGNYLLQDIGKNSGIFNQKGTYGIKATFAGTGLLQPTSSTAQALLVGNSAGYAVIVEGKVPNEEGLLSHNKTANRIYQHLLDRGFAAANVYYFNYNTSQPGVTGAPSKANVQNAIETLVKSKMNSVASPLWVIMVDHGGPEKFYLGNDSITPADLDLWLTNLEQNLNEDALKEKRIIVVGACYSGSFIPALSSSATTNNAGRLVITSAAASEESYKGPQEPDNVRSGEFFLEEFFNELAKGTSIKIAFQAAADSTRAFTSQGAGSANALNQYGDTSVQHPLLDDSGDGIGTNTITDTTADGVLADAHYLGVGVTNSAANPADLIAVTEPLYLDSSTTQAPLWAKPDSYSSVDTAWIEVKAPSTSLAAKGGTGQLELNIPKTFMTPDDSTKLWTLPTGTSCGTACFNEPGKYEIYYFTRNLYTEAISQMQRSVVYKDKAGNHAPTAPALVSPPTGTVTKTSVFLEWGTSTDQDNDPITYTIEIALNSNFTGTNVVIRREGLTDTWLFVGPEDGLEDQTLYGWRVLAVDAYGANAVNSPNTFTTNNTNIGLPASVSVIVKDAVTKAPIQGATVSFNSSIQKTTDAQGKCGIGLSGGQDVKVSAAASTYISSGTYTVSVVDGQGKSQEILLAPISTTTNSLKVTIAGSGGTVVSNPSGIMCGSTCNASFSSTQSITLTAAAGPGTVFTGWTGDCSGSGTCTVALSSAKNVTASFTAAPSGQVPDGILVEHTSVTAADALRALQIAAGIGAPATAYELAHGDVAPMVNGVPKGDGKIDLGDVIAILRKSVGLETTW